jgi:DUF177 domain-containing protein
MPEPTSSVDLARLSLSHGQAVALDVPVREGPLKLAGQSYEPKPQLLETRLDVSRTSSGYAMRLRFVVHLEGPCQRCLEDAGIDLAVDTREVDQQGARDEELRSPYVDGDELDVGAWAHDAIALALPAQILCRDDCAGLCPVCGESLNDADPEAHEHEGRGDPRWEKLRELRLE